VKAARRSLHPSRRLAMILTLGLPKWESRLEDRRAVSAPARLPQTGDDEPFNGLIFVENWFEEVTERVPIP
jgi:hypothetical protein